MAIAPGGVAAGRRSAVPAALVPFFVVLSLVSPARGAPPASELVIQAGHDVPTVVAAVPGGDRFLTGGTDGSIKVIDRLGRVWRTIPVCSYWIHRIEILAQSRIVALCGDHLEYEFDIDTGQPLGVRPGQHQIGPWGPNSFNRELRQPLSASDGSFRIQRFADGLLHGSGLAGEPADVVLPSSGVGIESVAWSGGDYLGLGLATGGVQLWDMRTGIPLETTKVHEAPVHSLAFDGASFGTISGGYDGVVRYHGLQDERIETLLTIPVETGRGWSYYRDLPETLRRDASGRLPPAPPAGFRLADAPRPNTDLLFHVATSADGRRFVATGRGGFVRVGERGGNSRDIFAGSGALSQPMAVLTADGARVAVLYPERVDIVAAGSGEVLRSIALAEPGQVITFAGASEQLVVVGFRSGVIRGWRLGDGTEALSLKSPASVTALAWWPGGNSLIAAGPASEVLAWRLDALEMPRSLSARSSAVRALSIHPSKPYLAAAGSNGAVYIWNLETGVLLVTMVAATDRDWVVVDGSGYFDGPTASWDRVRFRVGSGLFPPEQFAKVFWQPGVLAEVYDSGRLMVDLLRERRDPRLGASIADLVAAVPPQIAIRLADQKAAGGRRQEFEVVTTDRGSGARDLRVFREGSLVFRQDGPVAPRQLVPITMLAGRNTITAYAFSAADTRSSVASVDAAGPAAAPVVPTLRVIAVGVNEYARKPLRYAVSDARAVLAALQEAAPAGYRVAPSEALVDTAAKKDAVRRRFREVAETAEPEDLVVISFAGHGVRRGDRLHLLPYDYRLEEVGAGEMRTISDLDLQEWVAPIRAARIMLIIDACHSGLALEAEDARRGPMNARGLGQLAFEKGIYFVGASQGYQSALEHWKYGHGLLTHALIEEGLRQMLADRRPRDHRLVAEELLAYVEERVPQLQIDRIHDRNIGFRPTEADGEQTTSWVQRPSVYFPRELARNPLVLRVAP